MSTNINYVISCVNYEDGDARIHSVTQHRWLGDGKFETQGTLVKRSVVVANLDAKLIYFTVYQQDGKWYVGDNVIKFTLNNIDYIRTDGDNTPKDNLRNLPSCTK